MRFALCPGHMLHANLLTLITDNRVGGFHWPTGNWQTGQLLMRTHQHVFVLEKLFEKFHPNILLCFYGTTYSYRAMVPTDAID